MMRVPVLLPDLVQVAAPPEPHRHDDAEEAESEAGSQELGDAALQRERNRAPAGKAGEELAPGGPRSRAAPIGRGGDACRRNAGRTGRHRLQEASSTIHRTRSPNE